MEAVEVAHDESLDSWVDVDEVFPGLGTEPFFVAVDRHDDLVSRLSEVGFQVVEVDLSDCQTDEDFVARFGWAINAPEYFGENWDALNDVLRDHEPVGAWKIALIILGGRGFAARNLHGYSRVISLLLKISERVSATDSPIGQLEVFCIDGEDS